MSRYQRQIILPEIGERGQEKLARARVLLVGCGALGCVVADQLMRAGVGFLRIADRDIVELTNLQRQTLFDEADAENGLPKAVAAVERLAKINSQVTVEPLAIDVHSGNAESIADVDLIVDGTDNVATRYLMNDVSVKRGVPWVYGACVGMEGRAMAVRPGETACLRCIFPTPPDPRGLPTCDTAGVLGAAAGVIGSLQAAMAIGQIVGRDVRPVLVTVDLAAMRFREIATGERDVNCPCCGARRFEFLDRSPDESSVTLCGRAAVQIRGAGAVALDDLADKWGGGGEVERNRYFVRCRLREPAGVVLTGFADGRVIVQGTRDLARATSIYARFVGA
jgi:adenylyltransferase/sulfurtransferase